MGWEIDEHAVWKTIDEIQRHYVALGDQNTLLVELRKETLLAGQRAQELEEAVDMLLAELREIVEASTH